MVFSNKSHFYHIKFLVSFLLLIGCSGCASTINGLGSQSTFKDSKKFLIDANLESCHSLATLYLTYDELTETLKPKTLPVILTNDSSKEITNKGVAVLKNSFLYKETEVSGGSRPQIISEVIGDSKHAWFSLELRILYELSLNNSIAQLTVSADASGKRISKFDPTRKESPAQINNDIFQNQFNSYLTETNNYVASLYKNKIDEAIGRDFSQSTEFKRLNESINSERQRTGLSLLNCASQVIIGSSYES